MANGDMYDELIESTSRILRLGPNDFRVTDRNLFSKNPKYPLCDIVLKLDYPYSLEYLLGLWSTISKQEPKFVFKNNGSAISMSCYLQPSVKIENRSVVKEFNILRVNETLIVCMNDIEAIKPSSSGVLTKCIIRRNRDSTFVLEFVAFGPENETEYNSLLKLIKSKHNLLFKQDINKNQDGCQLNYQFLKRKSSNYRSPIKRERLMTSYRPVKTFYGPYEYLNTKRDNTAISCRNEIVTRHAVSFKLMQHRVIIKRIFIFFCFMLFFGLSYAFYKIFYSEDRVPVVQTWTSRAP